MDNQECNGVSRCKTCKQLGNCPSDHQHCDYCGIPLEDGEAIETVSEEVIVTVCPDCYKANIFGIEEFITND